MNCKSQWCTKGQCAPCSTEPALGGCSVFIILSWIVWNPKLYMSTLSYKNWADSKVNQQYLKYKITSEKISAPAPHHPFPASVTHHHWVFALSQGKEYRFNMNGHTSISWGWGDFTFVSVLWRVYCFFFRQLNLLKWAGSKMPLLSHCGGTELSKKQVVYVN